MKRAGISVSNARYTVECTVHNVVNKTEDPGTARQIAAQHAADHKANGDKARVFVGRRSWLSAFDWSRRA